MPNSSPAEVRSLLQQTDGTESVLQVRIHLHLLGELQSLDLNEGRGDSLHVALGVAEGDPPGPDGILVPVSVNAGVDDTAEEIIEDVSEALRIEHPVECSDKDRLLRIKSLTGTPDVVAVGEDPWDDLHLLTPHPPAGVTRL